MWKYDFKQTQIAKEVQYVFWYSFDWIIIYAIILKI